MLGLKFNGTWRNYQKQVLDNFQEYQADGHVHLVAAPGSGKTTIGIELIARFDKPALVLVPTVTIREQWVDRIRQAFLEDENQVTSLVSQNLKDMKQITIATYQAFHSAMQQVQSQEDNGEVEDFVGFDLLARLQSTGVRFATPSNIFGAILKSKLALTSVATICSCWIATALVKLPSKT